MKITIPETVLRNGEIINIKKENQVKKPIIVSDTIPKFVQDDNGMWVKNPLYVEDTDGMWIKNPDLQLGSDN
mgnify:FL=1|jgi:hypothetical protein|tara:strand:+ start:2027 stop:2242 length:216 start_codon:yes stop_codon:yes gene_type:complete